MNCAPAKGCVWPVLAPARGDCARGGTAGGIRNWGAGLSASGLAALARRFASVHARRCGSVVAFCRRFASGLDVLLERFAIDSRPALRFWRGGLPSVHACCLSRDKQDGLRNLAFLFRRVEIAFVRSRSVGAVICLCGFTSGLRVSCRRSRRVTGNTGKRGWRRGACASLRNRIGFEMLSAGSTLRQNVEAALRPPQTASKSRMWKRHCRLSGLSSHCGGLL